MIQTLGMIHALGPELLGAGVLICATCRALQATAAQARGAAAK